MCLVLICLTTMVLIIVSGYILDAVWFTLKPQNGFGQTYKQASKKTDFTVDLTRLGSPQQMKK